MCDRSGLLQSPVRVLTYDTGDMGVYATAGTTPEPSPVTSSAEEVPATVGEPIDDGDFTTTIGQDISETLSETLSAEAMATIITSSTSSPPPLYVSFPDTKTTTVQPTSSTFSPPPLIVSIPRAFTTVSTSILGPDAAGPDSTAVPPNTPEDGDKSSTAVPIGVGVAVGASVLIAASVLVFLYQRKRRRQAPVRAETPPPFEFSFINNQAQGWSAQSDAAKPPEMHDNTKIMAGLGGTGRAELP